MNNEQSKQVNVESAAADGSGPQVTWRRLAVALGACGAIIAAAIALEAML